jgi:hypothetical protein
MKRTALLSLAVAGIVTALGISLTRLDAAPEKTKMLRHVVMFKFKADATKEQIQGIVDAFNDLPKKIDTIQKYEHGVNNSEEGHSKGLTHIFLVTFKDEAGRAKYLPHPAHNAFVEKLKPILDDACVVDYVPEE